MTTYKEVKEALNGTAPSQHIIDFNDFSKKAFGLIFDKTEEKQESWMKKHIEKGTFTEQDVVEFIDHIKKINNRVLHKFGNSKEEIERMEEFVKTHKCGKSWIQKEADFEISPVTGIVRCIYEYK